LTDSLQIQTNPTETGQEFALFDVDGTVIAKDSFRILIKELIFNGSVFNALIRSVLAATLFTGLAVFRIFGWVEKTQFKSALLWSATVGLGRRESIARIRKAVDLQVRPLWFSEVLPEIDKHRSLKRKICFVSASGELWLRMLINQVDLGPKLIIGSKLMFFLGGITLRGRNCLGQEKIHRLKAVLPVDAIWDIAYSDHRADMPLLRACRKRIVVNPTKKNLQIFQKVLGTNGFQLVHWTTPGAPHEAKTTQTQ